MSLEREAAASQRKTTNLKQSATEQQSAAERNTAAQPSTARHSAARLAKRSNAQPQCIPAERLHEAAAQQKATKGSSRQQKAAVSGEGPSAPAASRDTSIRK